MLQTRLQDGGQIQCGSADVRYRDLGHADDAERDRPTAIPGAEDHRGDRLPELLEPRVDQSEVDEPAQAVPNAKGERKQNTLGEGLPADQEGIGEC